MVDDCKVDMCAIVTLYKDIFTESKENLYDSKDATAKNLWYFFIDFFARKC